MATDSGAIGVFDSGVGGLTVFARIAERLPNEPIIYLGDTARVPYGTKSADTVIRYARACASVLADRGIKLLVVACNTASAYALDTLREELGIPVLGVIEPGAAAAVKQTRNRRVGVIGTTGTIESGQYPQTIRAMDPGIEVFCRACPLFVPLAEEGWIEGDIPRRVAETYLRDLGQNDIDTLVLGCTHYPLLRGAVDAAMGGSVCLIDSAAATAEAVAAVFDAMDLHATGDHAPEHRFLATDAPGLFARVGRRFLGNEIGNVEWVDF